MTDNNIKELAYWLNNNIDWASEMPKIFSGVEQEKLEKCLKGEF